MLEGEISAKMALLEGECSRLGASRDADAELTFGRSDGGGRSTLGKVDGVGKSTLGTSTLGDPLRRSRQELRSSELDMSASAVGSPAQIRDFQGPASVDRAPILRETGQILTGSASPGHEVKPSTLNH